MDEEPFLRSVYRQIGLSYPKFFKMDTLSQLGFLGAEMTLMRSDLENHDDDDVAVVFSNRSASLETDRAYYDSYQSGIASPAQFVYTLPNIEVGEICIRHKLFGENNFLVSERFNAEQLLDQCQALFNANAARAVLIGWTEVENGELDGFFAFIASSGTNPISSERLTEMYLDR